MKALRRLRVWLTFIALLLSSRLAFAQATQPTADTPAPATRPALAAVVVLKGVVDEYSQETLIQRFEQAKAAGAKTIILKLDTPGGLVLAAQQITTYLREQKDIHTVAF